MIEIIYKNYKKKIWKKIIVEFFRLKKMGELYKLYVEIHKTYNLPVKNFNRWIFGNALYYNKKYDPVIPNELSHDALYDIFESAFKKNNKQVNIREIISKLLSRAKNITDEIRKHKIKIKFAKLTYDDNIFVFTYNDNNKWEIKIDQLIIKHLNSIYIGTDKIKYLRIFRLLVRYENIEFERNNQGASPREIFKLLEENGCEMEMFAAPQYSYFKKCCSAYYDTDRHFGSKGSFMNFFPKNGIYQGAPINSNYFLNSILKHIIDILKNANKICFILFLPDWDDLEYLNIIDKLGNNNKCNNECTRCIKYIVPKNIQIYESKNTDGNNKITIVPNSSRIYFIQKNMNINHKKIYDDIINIYKTKNKT